MANRVLIIGAGGVGRVTTFKCAQRRDIFSDITLASRTKGKCDAIVSDIHAKGYKEPIRTAAVDAGDVLALVALFKEVKPNLVIHVALPYQNLTIMDACLEAGVHYLDTANYESLDNPHFCYGPQWVYHERFEKAGLMALLGIGFDPGVTNVFVTHAKKHHFDRMDTVDIIDCNAGDHGYPFATNFNPEINIREITARGKYYENGAWHETAPLSLKKTFDFPEGIGPKEIYLIYHEEMESLVKFFPEVKRMRFWMTFGKSYLKHLEVLQNVGMTRIDPVMYEGREIVPLQFLKAMLPDPASLGPRTKGKTCIGVWITGAPRVPSANPAGQGPYYIYNTCVHEEAFAETGAQAVSYTTGVPAALGAKLLLAGQWSGTGVFNVEQLDPDPFISEIGPWGLPWVETFPTHDGLGG